jgi:anthranilate/para-aminobenzoate synthase component I
VHNLHQLIEQYGPPDSLIDHWDSSSNRFAIWGFEEQFIINSDGKAIINGNLSDISPLETWQNPLENWKSDCGELAAIGFISYDLKNVLYPHIPFKNPNASLPLLWFGKPQRVEAYKITENGQYPSPILHLEKDIPLPTEYETAISNIKTYLMNGDSYQINFTQPKQFKLKTNPLDIYLSMRETVHPHYGMYLKIDKLNILSFSPERFFRTLGRKIESFPMKGTRPRSADLIRDGRLAGELYHSEKDRAEHLMIVDLLRNDIGKVCEYGSVNVEDLYGIHSFETVHQMVSRVYGKLQPSINETDIIKSLFPGGSITGAPKERSMKIIDSLEEYQRGVYTGALGYIQKNGDMDFNIGIRTMTIQGDIGIYPVGGGIVWDSDSLEEWQEAQQKSEIFSPYKYKPATEQTDLESASLTY